ncbi:hypothetical protein GGE09_000138 [Roseobacter sp. N2S]|nr:hypothetical protein [Roseobacter sp. N2S]
MLFTLQPSNIKEMYCGLIDKPKVGAMMPQSFFGQISGRTLKDGGNKNLFVKPSNGT